MKHSPSTSSNFRAVLLLGAVLASAIFTNCNRPKGQVAILNIYDTVENCSPPYIVSFHPEVQAARDQLIYRWDFGDGNISNAAFPVNIYQEPGVYEITLEVTEREVTAIQTIVLNINSESLPVLPDFELASVTGSYFVPCPVNFFNTSQHATHYFWDFGNGNLSSRENPFNLYEYPGRYQVTLGAICDGDTSYITKLLDIYPPPDDLNILTVTVWMPDSYKGGSYLATIYYGPFLEFTTPVASNVQSFPVGWNIYENMFFYDPGDTDILQFAIWDEGNRQTPVYVFSTRADILASQGYPLLVGWNEGNGFAAEVTFGYD